MLIKWHYNAGYHKTCVTWGLTWGKKWPATVNKEKRNDNNEPLLQQNYEAQESLNYKENDKQNNSNHDWSLEDGRRRIIGRQHQ
jgi:hypothetical protein